MTDDITKTARDLLDALPGYEDWHGGFLFIKRGNLCMLSADPCDALRDEEAAALCAAIAALPRTTAALVEEVERLRAAASDGLAKVDATVRDEVERLRAQNEELRRDARIGFAVRAALPGDPRVFDVPRYLRHQAESHTTKGAVLLAVARTLAEEVEP